MRNPLNKDKGGEGVRAALNNGMQIHYSFPFFGTFQLYFVTYFFPGLMTKNQVEPLFYARERVKGGIKALTKQREGVLIEGAM